MVNELFKEAFSGTDNSNIAGFLGDDERMRNYIKWIMKISVAVSVLLLLILCLQPKTVVATILTFLKEVLASLGLKDISPGVLLVVLIGVFLFCLNFFAHFIVDILKVHYKIDSLTFSLIRDVNDYIAGRFAVLFCDEKYKVCKLRNFKSGDLFTDHIRDEVYYNFTNRDVIGSHDQKGYRAYVFRSWGIYYAFDFCLLCLVVASEIILIVSVAQTALGVAAFSLILFICLLIGLNKLGRKSQERFRRFVDKQIAAIVTHEKNELIALLRKQVLDCPASSCPLK